MQFAHNKERMAVVLGIGIAVAILFFAIILKYTNNSVSMNTVYENIVEKKKVLAQMRIHLLKSVEMEKNAVMALTDQQSMDFANQSRSASATVTQNMNLLRALIDAMPMQNEKQLLDEFAACWAEFGKIDQRILDLAVENTNLKAASLSREKGGETMRTLEHSLASILQSSAGTPNQGQVSSLISRAMIAGLKMYNLHSSHIAESDDEKMDQIEAQMQREENEVAQCLATLGDIIGPESPETVSQARTAFAEFVAVTAQVKTLSRQNSNIKSLQLSLGRKRTIAAQCDEVLAALQETVHNKTFKATK